MEQCQQHSGVMQMLTDIKQVQADALAEAREFRSEMRRAVRDIGLSVDATDDKADDAARRARGAWATGALIVTALSGWCAFLTYYLVEHLKASPK